MEPLLSEYKRKRKHIKQRLKEFNDLYKEKDFDVLVLNSLEEDQISSYLIKSLGRKKGQRTLNIIKKTLNFNKMYPFFL